MPQPRTIRTVTSKVTVPDSLYLRDQRSGRGRVVACRNVASSRWQVAPQLARTGIVVAETKVTLYAGPV